MSLKKFSISLDKKKKNKFGAKKTIFNGVKYDSKAEAEYAALLGLHEKMGIVSEIETQPKVYLSNAKILYKPDFCFLRNGQKIYVDVKGHRTAVFNIKKRLWAAYTNDTLEIVKKQGGKFIVVEVVQGNMSEALKNNA